MLAAPFVESQVQTLSVAAARVVPALLAPTCTELLCKFPGEVEGNSSEIGVPQQIVQVVAQQLKHQTEMVPKHKVTLQVDCTETDRQTDTKRQMGDMGKS